MVNMSTFILTVLKTVISCSVFLIPKGNLMVWEQAIMKSVTGLASTAENA